MTTRIIHALPYLTLLSVLYCDPSGLVRGAVFIERPIAENQPAVSFRSFQTLPGALIVRYRYWPATVLNLPDRAADRDAAISHFAARFTPDPTNEPALTTDRDGCFKFPSAIPRGDRGLIFLQILVQGTTTDYWLYHDGGDPFLAIVLLTPGQRRSIAIDTEEARNKCR